MKSSTGRTWKAIMFLCLLKDRKCPTTLTYMPSRHETLSSWLEESWEEREEEREEREEEREEREKRKGRREREEEREEREKRKGRREKRKGRREKREGKVRKTTMYVCVVRRWRRGYKEHTFGKEGVEGRVHVRVKDLSYLFKPSSYVHPGSCAVIDLIGDACG